MLYTDVVKEWKFFKSRNERNILKATQQFEESLVGHGFNQVGCGKHAVVYGSRGLDYVVKIGDRIPNSALPNPFEESRLENLFVSACLTFSIQPKAHIPKNEALKLELIKMLCTQLNVTDDDLLQYDIHADNVGVRGGEVVIVDYAV